MPAVPGGGHRRPTRSTHPDPEEVPVSPTLARSAPFTVLLALALTAAVLTPGAPVLAACLVAAALAHRLLARHHVHRLPAAWGHRRALAPAEDAAPAVTG